MHQIWDIAKRQTRPMWEGHLGKINSLAFSRDGRLLVSGSEDETVRIWDTETGAHKALLIIGPTEVRD